VHEVEADGASGLAAVGGELEPELGAFFPVGQEQEAGEGQGAAGVAGGVDAGDAPGGVDVVEDALAQGAQFVCGPPVQQRRLRADQWVKAIDLARSFWASRAVRRSLSAAWIAV
jgi:hypothetical protein